MNGYQAAQRVRRYVAKKYAAYEPDQHLVAWSAKRSREGFWGENSPMVVWEGGPYDWAINVSFDEGILSELRADGFYLECMTGFALIIARI